MPIPYRNNGGYDSRAAKEEADRLKYLEAQRAAEAEKQRQFQAEQAQQQRQDAGRSRLGQLVASRPNAPVSQEDKDFISGRIPTREEAMARQRAIQQAQQAENAAKAKAYWDYVNARNAEKRQQGWKPHGSWVDQNGVRHEFDAGTFDETVAKTPEEMQKLKGFYEAARQGSAADRENIRQAGIRDQQREKIAGLTAYQQAVKGGAQEMKPGIDPNTPGSWNPKTGEPSMTPEMWNRQTGTTPDFRAGPGVTAPPMLDRPAPSMPAIPAQQQDANGLLPGDRENIQNRLSRFIVQRPTDGMTPEEAARRFPQGAAAYNAPEAAQARQRLATGLPLRSPTAAASGPIGTPPANEQLPQRVTGYENTNINDYSGDRARRMQELSDAALRSNDPAELDRIAAEQEYLKSLPGTAGQANWQAQTGPELPVVGNTGEPASTVGQIVGNAASRIANQLSQAPTPPPFAPTPTAAEQQPSMTQEQVLRQIYGDNYDAAMAYQNAIKTPPSDMTLSGGASGDMTIPYRDSNDPRTRLAMERRRATELADQGMTTEQIQKTMPNMQLPVRSAVVGPVRSASDKPAEFVLPQRQVSAAEGGIPANPVSPEGQARIDRMAAETEAIRNTSTGPAADVKRQTAEEEKAFASVNTEIGTMESALSPEGIKSIESGPWGTNTSTVANAEALAAKLRGIMSGLDASRKAAVLRYFATRGADAVQRVRQQLFVLDSSPVLGRLGYNQRHRAALQSILDTLTM